MRLAWTIVASLSMSGLASAQPVSLPQPFAAPTRSGEGQTGGVARFELADNRPAPRFGRLCITPVRMRTVGPQSGLSRTNPHDQGRAGGLSSPPSCEPPSGLIQ